MKTYTGRVVEKKQGNVIYYETEDVREVSPSKSQTNNRQKTKQEEVRTTYTGRVVEKTKGDVTYYEVEDLKEVLPSTSPKPKAELDSEGLTERRAEPKPQHSPNVTNNMGEVGPKAKYVDPFDAWRQASRDIIIERKKNPR